METNFAFSARMAPRSSPRPKRSASAMKRSRRRRAQHEPRRQVAKKLRHRSCTRVYVSTHHIRNKENGRSRTGEGTAQPNPPPKHRGPRAFLKAPPATAGGMAVANWGGLSSPQTTAQEAARQNKRCIL